MNDLTYIIKKNLKGTVPYNIAFNAYYGFRRVLSRIFQEITLKFVFPLTYYKNSRRPVKTNKLIIIEVREGTLSNDFKLIYDRLRSDYRVNIHIHYLEDYKAGFLKYFRRCFRLIEDMANAKYILISDACRPVNCMTLRKETVFMQVWHACGAFKRFGLSSADQLFGDTRRMQEHFPFHKNYTYAAVSSEEVVWAYDEAFGFSRNSGIVRPTGISRTDVFFENGYVEAAKARVEKFFPESRGKKIILYAPTFRGRVATAAAPDRLDIGAMYAALSDEYVLLIKHHPFIKELPKIADRYSSFARDCTGMLDIEDCLCAADICVTDYSSVIFEYSLFERPMIFFAYDLDDYNDWRGFFYPYEEMTPGPVCRTNEEMIDYIKNIGERFDKKQVHDFREKFMGACDGHATERILKLIFGKDEKRLRR